MGELTGSISPRVQFRETEGLVLRLKAREEAAFAEVFCLYKDLVYTLSLSMLTDKSEAMDVTQDVFLTLYRKISQFRGECTLKTWLYRVTFNKVSNRNRWWRRRLGKRTVSLGLSVPGGGPSLELVSEDPLPDRDLLSKEIREALRGALQRLPFEQRAAVALRDVEGLGYGEIAAVLGVRIGTVKSRIARGRERLRQLLHEYREGNSS